MPCPKCSHRGGLTVESKQVGVVPWSVQASRVQATGRGGLEAFLDAADDETFQSRMNPALHVNLEFVGHCMFLGWRPHWEALQQGTLNRCLMSDLCFSVGLWGKSNGFQRYSYIRIHSHLNTLNLTYAIPAILCPTDATNVLPATSKPI